MIYFGDTLLPYLVYGRVYGMMVNDTVTIASSCNQERICDILKLVRCRNTSTLAACTRDVVQCNAMKLNSVKHAYHIINFSSQVNLYFNKFKSFKQNLNLLNFKVTFERFRIFFRKPFHHIVCNDWVNRCINP